MSIQSISGAAGTSGAGANRFAKAKQAFDDLASALQSGDLTSAKEAFAALQDNLPPRANQAGNPLAAKIDALGQALDKGDLASARQAFADIQSSLAQRPSRGGQPSGGLPPGGAPPTGGPHGGGHGGGHGTEKSGSSSTNQTYDPKDTNQDGTVSLQEELIYNLSHAQATKSTTSSAANGATSNSIDLVA